MPAHPCFDRAVCSSGPWHALMQELIKMQGCLNTDVHSHLCESRTVSIQWPIHFNANCRHLNGVGQHVENKGENAFNRALFMDGPYNAPDSTALGQRSVFSLRVLSCFQLVRQGFGLTMAHRSAYLTPGRSFL